MLPLLLFVFWIGVYPNTFFEKMNPAMEQALEQMGRKVAVVEMQQPATGELGHGETPAQHGHN